MAETPTMTLAAAAKVAAGADAFNLWGSSFQGAADSTDRAAAGMPTAWRRMLSSGRDGDQGLRTVKATAGKRRPLTWRASE
ncbi:hypothetical protein GCM10027073_55630 [Streptomyces chlorus]